MNSLFGLRASFAPCRFGLTRSYTTQVKPNIKLLAKLRQETEVSMTKAKEALVKNDNDYAKALEWLSADAQASGAKKAEKVAGRTAGEGLITIASVNNRSTMIELNCETDFVSRNDVFKNLAARIATTSLLLHDTPAAGSKAIEHLSVKGLMNAPLMPLANETSADLSKTVQESIVETIGKLGENITLRRAAVVVDGVSAAYVHGGDSAAGNIGGIAVLQPRKVTVGELEEKGRAALAKTARQVARQVVGYSPVYLTKDQVPASVLEQNNPEEYITNSVLTEQAFMLRPDQNVAVYVDEVAKNAGLEGAEVVDFARWQVGEGIEKKESDFADEVMRTVRGN
ncbi:elongation factor TS-domain-containing protein [Phycomyces blakesleeanus]|uniref:Elongation factor Ts, mitochondrial n=1 Tax=Phycomyces blakesleeanus TaxID=4837 RepID=A0ABR3ARF3_PHYBL